MIESAKLGEFDLMDIDRDEQRLHYLSLFAVVGKYSALMWHHKSVGGSVVGGVVESRSIAKDIHRIFVPPAGDGIGKGGEYRSSIFADEVSDQVLAMELSNHLN